MGIWVDAHGKEVFMRPVGDLGGPCDVVQIALILTAFLSYPRLTTRADEEVIFMAKQTFFALCTV